MKLQRLILQIDSTFTLESYRFILLLISFFSSKIIFIKFLKCDLVVFVSRLDLLRFLLALKFNQYTQYKFLVDIFGVDNIKYNKLWRFEVVYHLLSICYISRIFVKTNLNEFSFLDSTIELYKGASWYEREVWDMFGIFFSGHLDLRRILTDYGFNGFPLRKDYPLTGFYELRYSDQRASVVYEPLTLTQEYRYFNFLSPWNT